jgi:uncharacterized repeat protein (TIGR01451 family)
MKRLGMFFAFTLVMSVFQLGGAGIIAAHADSKTINFENPPYIPGSINNQDGWSATGPYDQAVVDNSVLGVAPASFAAQSFRMSNAITSGSFGDQVFSKSLTDEAGEADAVNGGLSGGTRQPHFEATFDIASTVPGSEQPGLQLAVSPDRGDGARMSFLRFRDTSNGLAVDFNDYQDSAPLGAVANISDGCGAEDDFVETTIASGLSRSTRHTVKLTMDLLNGPHNDVVRVFIDGALVHTGTSWEDFFRFCGGDNTSRTVDSLLFRAAGTAVPGTLGKGFLFDNLTLASGPLGAATADLSVTKSASSPAKVGSPLTYTITIHNAGPGGATGVTLTDTLPSGVAFVSATPGTGTCSQSAGTVSCNIGSLALNGSVTVKIVVSPSAAGNITNTAKVAGSTSDSTTTNNTASVTTTVTAASTSTGHRRSISLKLGDGLRARGKVTVGDGFTACAASVPVKIQRRVSGAWKNVGSTTTSASGSYKKKIKDKPGKYRAKAPKVILNGGVDVCKVDTSPVRKNT